MSRFHYVTHKYVVLKDVRLGLSYYLLMLLIVSYTFVGIFYQKGYLEFDTKPQGVIRVILSSNLANESFSPESLPYCVQEGISCRYVDPNELVWPVEGRAVTLTTFAKDRVQRLNVSTNSPRDEYEIVKETQYFTQGPEYAVLKVDHAVVASLFTDDRGTERLAASKRKMKGYLVNSKSRVMREISVPGKPDKLPVQWLLEAAGMKGLDEVSDSVNAKGRSYRERGCVLRVSIFYQNWYNTWYGTSDIEYMYQVKKIPHLDYNSKQVLPYSPPEGFPTSGRERWRMLRKRYSIRVEFEQSGSLGMFSLPTLLLKLVSGMGLLTLTATVIDTIALYLLPDRFIYRDNVYEQSEEIKSSFNLKKKQ